MTKKHDTVYVVMGECGEFSDYDTWPIVAFFNEKEAQEYVTKASERADEWDLLVDIANERLDKIPDGVIRADEERVMTVPEGWSSYDPEFSSKHKGTGIGYWYLTAPVGKPVRKEGSDQ